MSRAQTIGVKIHCDVLNRFNALTYDPHTGERSISLVPHMVELLEKWIREQEKLKEANH